MSHTASFSPMSIKDTETEKVTEISTLKSRIGCMNIKAPHREDEDDDLYFYDTGNPSSWIQIRGDFYMQWK